MSLDTIGASVYSKTPFSGPSAAALKAALISSTDAGFFRLATKSVMEPVGTGTRSEVPSSFPFIDSNTKLVALAAPVLVGVMLIAAPRARRKSLCGPSTKDWSPVYAWIVVIKPFSTPNASSRTFTIGTKQLVVQLALEITLCFDLSKSWWLTPYTKVASAPLDGADTITIGAPASR